MVERWLVPLIPFRSYKLCASDRPGAVKGARFARRSEPLTARTDLESYEGEGKGILQPSSHLPTKNPEYPQNLTPRIASAKGRVKPLARLLRCATALRVTAPLGCGSRRLERDGQRRAAQCLSDSSARSWLSAASVSRAPGRGPARFPRPILDARLGDGSRVAICVPPASPHLAITARRFGARSFSAAQLVAQGALPAHIRDEAERVLHTRRNILVSGGTASGNTTLLNVLIALIPDDERIVAIEDTLELRIDSPNCVRFETRGLQQGAITISDR